MNNQEPEFQSEPENPNKKNWISGFAVAPPTSPRVLMQKNSSLVEFFYRVMYIVFLAYSALVIGAGVLSLYAILGQMFIGPVTPSAWAVNICFLLMLLYLGHVRDFWDKKFDLWRMDANFSGIRYLEAHLDNPHWEQTKMLFEQLSGCHLPPIEKEVVRRKLTRLARNNPSIYEAIYELADDRLRWTLVHANLSD